MIWQAHNNLCHPDTHLNTSFVARRQKRRIYVTLKSLNDRIPST